MYLHLGSGVVVPEADIIGIFDMDNTTSSHITRGFLNDAEKAGSVTSVSDELPNSFVVCSRMRSANTAIHSSGPIREIAKGTADHDMKVYLSQLSSQTLGKRSGTMRFE